MSTDFVFTIYDDKLAVASKQQWNANRGYVPSNNVATQEALAYLITLSPDFSVASECFFHFGKPTKKNVMAARKLLLQNGVTEANLGTIVE